MPDTQADLRPSGGVYSTSWQTTAVGAVDPPTDWSDDDDATWWEQQTYGGTADLSLADLSLPAFAVVKSLTVKIRASDPNNTGAAFFATALKTTSAGQQATGNTPTLDTTIRTYTLTTLTSLNGRPLTGALVNALRLVIAAYDLSGPATQHHRIYEVAVTVVYNQAPVVTVTAPTGTIRNTSTPTITHTYSDAEGDPQERLRYKVFSAAQYGAGDFDPETSHPTWSSGELLTDDTSRDVGSPLPNSDTYKAYAKAADRGSAGRYGDWDAGPAFTMAVDPPNIPVIVAPEADDDNAWVQMAVYAYENELTDNQASLETDTTGWAAGTNTTIARSTAESQNGAASLLLTAVANGDMFANTSPAPVDVVPGQIYAALASFLADSTARDCRVAIRWRDGGAAVLSTSNGPLRTDDTSGWPGARCVAYAPANAATGEVIVQVVGASAGEKHYVDEVAFRPSNDNLLSVNQASFEVDLTGWTAGINATISRSQAAALVHSGLNSLAVTAVAGGNMAARTTGLMAAKAGVGYTVSAWTRAVSVARNWTILVRFYDSAGVQIGVDADTTSPAVLNSLGDWTRIVYSPGNSPAGTYFLSVHLQVAAPAAGEIHVFDDVSVSELTGTGEWSPGQVGWSRGGLSGKKVEIQRSDDGGDAWVAARVSVGTTLAAPSSDPFTLNEPGQYRTVVVDHEAPRGVQVQYRARSTATVGGLTLVGDWSYPMPADLAVVGEWLKAPLDATLNIPICMEAPLESVSTETQAVGAPVGSGEYVVAGGDVRGEVGSMALWFDTDAEWQAFEAIRKAQTTLLLQTMYGDGTGAAEQLYVRLGPDRSVTRVGKGGDPSLQMRAVKVGYRQVRPPS